MKGNPYIGPRPYERQDAHNFYGRAREARDLLSLILANRVVLFYAQSGAGKTSLLNTQIIPALEERGFYVLPMARVGRDLPPGIGPKDVPNIFVFSALMGLSGAQPDIPPRQLTRHTLLVFLRQFLPISQTVEPDLERDEDETLTAVGVRRPPILIIDQFEEILTTHRDRWQDARGFFEQLQEALRKIPDLGIVLAMREDHIAGLDPHAPLLSKRLRTRFRMERLTVEGALEAVKKPALRAGCPFAPGVAEQLVDDLRRIKTLPSPAAENEERPSGAGEGGIALGPYIEPVQLQVVCNRLWENLPEELDHDIGWEEVQRYGNIDRALTEFYESALAQATQQTNVPERPTRRWFNDQLITPWQTRGLVLRGEHSTGGLPNAAVDVLENRHLIRADVRAGTWYYELVHDRLIEPILQSNQEWEVARQTPLRTTAKRWQETKSDSMLYRDKALKEASAWVKAHPDEAEPYEVEFLAVSQRVEQIRRRTRTLTLVGVVGAVLTALAMAFLAITANQARQAAEQQRQIALARQLAAQAQMALDNSGAGLVKSVLLAVESMRRHPTLEGDQALRQGLSLLPRRAFQAEHQDEVYAVTFSPIGPLMASGSRHGTVRVWNLETRKQVSTMEHGGDTIAIVFSLDGQRITSWGTDGMARVWQVVTGQEIAHIQHEGSVDTVAFSPDGKWAAWGTWDGTIHVEATATGQEIARMTHGKDEIMALAFSPDGRWLASSGRDGTARVWETASGREISRIGHGGWVYIVAFSPDGKWVASGGDDGAVRVWEAATGRQVAQMDHKGPVYSVAFNPTGQWLASGSWDGTARVWETATGRPVAQMPHEGAVYAVAFSPDGQWVTCGSWDGTARIWETTSGREIARMAHEKPVRAVASSPDGRWVASGDREGTVQIWEAASGHQIIRLEGQEGMNAVAPSPDGRQIISGGWDDTVIGWEVATGQEVIRKTLKGAIWDVTFSPDGQWIAAATEWPDSAVRIWQARTGQEVVSQTKHKASVNAVAFGPDGRWVVSGDDDGTVLVWEAITGQEIAQMKHKGAVYAVTSSPNGQWVASGSNDGTVRVWAATTGREMAQMTHGSAVLAVASSPDSQWIASGGRDGTARIWKATTGQEIIRIKHQGPVTAVAFSPDGQWLVSGSRDGTARVWNTATGQEVARMKHDWVVSSVAFSPDGRWVFSGSWDGTVRVWMWRPDDMITEACARLRRNLTAEEWQLHLHNEPYRLTCPGLSVPGQ